MIHFFFLICTLYNIIKYNDLFFQKILKKLNLYMLSQCIPAIKQQSDSYHATTTATSVSFERISGGR